MGVWFSQKVSAIGKSEDLVKLLNIGKHADVVTMSPIVSIDELNKIEGHYKWTERLKYDEAVEMVGIKPLKQR